LQQCRTSQRNKLGGFVLVAKYDTTAVTLFCERSWHKDGFAMLEEAATSAGHIVTGKCVSTENLLAISTDRPPEHTGLVLVYDALYSGEDKGSISLPIQHLPARLKEAGILNPAAYITAREAILPQKFDALRTWGYSAVVRQSTPDVLLDRVNRYLIPTMSIPRDPEQVMKIE
jgi:hypothetical protein